MIISDSESVRDHWTGRSVLLNLTTKLKITLQGSMMMVLERGWGGIEDIQSKIRN